MTKPSTTHEDPPTVDVIYRRVAHRIATLPTVAARHRVTHLLTHVMPTPEVLALLSDADHAAALAENADREEAAWDRYWTGTDEPLMLPEFYGKPINTPNGHRWAGPADEGGHALAGCDGEDDVHDPSDDVADEYEWAQAL